jgi:23S rRNA pseudouridine1911/1915/1917 synthase
LVIDKPAGLVVHPAPGHAGGTLVNAILHHCRDISGAASFRPGIVHRLDKDTSGVMVVARNERAGDALIRQFKQGTVRKQYVAVVRGVPSPRRGTVRTLIGRSAHDRKKMAAKPLVQAATAAPSRKMGRLAVTHYEVVEEFGSASVLRLRIETGRTHQIRVHMAYIGYPVLGDRQYAGRARGRAELVVTAERQMLHAETLAFAHPTDGRPLEFRSPLPHDMQAVIEGLRAPPDSQS